MAFKAADTKIEHLGLELSLAEVTEIVENVCHRQTFRFYSFVCVINLISIVFRKVDLVEWDRYLRLASPNLETWAAHDGLRPGLGSLHTEAVDWPVRMEKHCKYIADKVGYWLSLLRHYQSMISDEWNRDIRPVAEDRT